MSRETKRSESRSADEDDRLYLSQGQGDLFDRRVEFISVLVLSVATVLTAWSAYQAALFDGDFMEASIEASILRSDAAQLRTQAMVEQSFHVGLFTAFAGAVADEDSEYADFLHQRMPPVLRQATDDWLATKPLKREDAPNSPFEMPSYALDLDAKAGEMETQAKERMADAGSMDDTSDHYVLLTVIFATVLFFSGIAGKFQWRVMDAAMLGLGIVVLCGGLVVLLRSPMQ